MSLKPSPPLSPPLPLVPLVVVVAEVVANCSCQGLTFISPAAVVLRRRLASCNFWRSLSLSVSFYACLMMHGVCFFWLEEKKRKKMDCAAKIIVQLLHFILQLAHANKEKWKKIIQCTTHAKFHPTNQPFFHSKRLSPPPPLSPLI